MKITTVRFLIIFAGIGAISLVGISSAQMPTAASAPAATDSSAPVTPADPSVTEDSRPGQLAVCNKVSTELESSAVKEMRKLMIHVVANDIFFTGAAYILFEMGADGKPTGTWTPCVQVRHLDGLPDARPAAPYYETSIPALLGIAATCPKEAPGPVVCKDILAKYLASKGLSAIGTPRITDKGNGATAISTIWVPYGVKP